MNNSYVLTEHDQDFLQNLAAKIIGQNRVVSFVQTSLALQAIHHLRDWISGNHFNVDMLLEEIFAYEGGKGEHYQSIIKHFGVEQELEYLLEQDAHYGRGLQKYITGMMVQAEQIEERACSRKTRWWNVFSHRKELLKKEAEYLRFVNDTKNLLSEQLRPLAEGN